MELLLLQNAQMHQLVMTLSAKPSSRSTAAQLCHRLLAVSWWWTFNFFSRPGRSTGPLYESVDTDVTSGGNGSTQLPLGASRNRTPQWLRVLFLQPKIKLPELPNTTDSVAEIIVSSKNSFAIRLHIRFIMLNSELSLSLLEVTTPVLLGLPLSPLQRESCLTF